MRLHVSSSYTGPFETWNAVTFNLRIHVKYLYNVPISCDDTGPHVLCFYCYIQRVLYGFLWVTFCQSGGKLGVLYGPMMLNPDRLHLSGIVPFFYSFQWIVQFLVIRLEGP